MQAWRPLRLCIFD